MLSLKQTFFLPLFVLFVSFVSVNQWNSIPVGNTTIQWGFWALTLAAVLLCKRKYFVVGNKKDYRVVVIYFVWMIIGVVRGAIEAEGYWTWKNFIMSSFALALPVFVYAFSIPAILQKTLHLWIRAALAVFAVFFVWALSRGAYHLYLGPVLLLACFLPVIPKKWKILFLVLLLFMMVINFQARSQVIKAFIALMMSGAYLMSKYITMRMFSIVHWLCYIVPIVLLVLGITGVFNPFYAMQERGGGERDVEVATTDTRSFIYWEVITSAVNNNYVWQGRTPAHGNDSEFVWMIDPVGALESDYQRHENEVCFANVFTWLGLVGLILYSLIYLRSSFLAVFRSNSVWMKLLGMYIAFRWAYGWIEDCNRFDIMGISLWMMIAMGLSEQFRRMSNDEFKAWVIRIFQK